MISISNPIQTSTPVRIYSLGSSSGEGGMVCSSISSHFFHIPASSAPRALQMILAGEVESDRKLEKGGPQNWSCGNLVSFVGLRLISIIFLRWDLWMTD